MPRADGALVGAADSEAPPPVQGELQRLRGWLFAVAMLTALFALVPGAVERVPSGAQAEQTRSGLRMPAAAEAHRMLVVTAGPGGQGAALLSTVRALELHAPDDTVLRLEQAQTGPSEDLRLETWARGSSGWRLIDDRLVDGGELMSLVGADAVAFGGEG